MEIRLRFPSEQDWAHLRSKFSGPSRWLGWVGGLYFFVKALLWLLDWKARIEEAVSTAYQFGPVFGASLSLVESSWFGVALIGCAILYAIFIPHEDHPTPNVRIANFVAWAACAASIVLLFLFTTFAFATRLSRLQAPSGPPDIAVRLVYPQSPALELLNASTIGIVRDPKYFPVICNLDSVTQPTILPIPTQTFTGEFIRPTESIGPWSLFDTPLVAPLVKPGNRLFGLVRALCPDCVRDRDFYVYVVYGQGGWYAPAQPTAGYINTNEFIKAIPVIAKEPDKYLAQLVPENTRIVIQSLP